MAHSDRKLKLNTNKCLHIKFFYLNNFETQWPSQNRFYSYGPDNDIYNTFSKNFPVMIDFYTLRIKTKLGIKRYVFP